MTAETTLRPPPWWMRLAATLVRRLPAGRYRTMNWLCRRSSSTYLTRLPAEMGGYWYRCDLRNSMTREVYFTGRYEARETALLGTFLRPGMTFVDVGANWGYFTLLAASRVSATGRVVSLEPDPRLFAILQGNVTRNHLRQVMPLPLAASNAPGVLTLGGFNDQADNWGLSKLGESSSGGPSFQVATERLDVILDKSEVDHVDLLKVDVEGAEDLVLEGANEGLARHRYRRILLEVHPSFLAERGKSVAEVLRLLTVAGYRGWEMDSDLKVARQVAYQRELHPDSFLRPLDPSKPSDKYRHFLWVAPGLELMATSVRNGAPAS